MASGHVESYDYRQRECEYDNVAYHVRKGRNLIHNVDVRVAILQLLRLGTPVVGDWMTLKDCSEENTDPPAESECRHAIDRDLEALSREETDIEGENGCFDDWHGACMQDLESEHDFSLGFQLFCHRKPGMKTGITINLLFTNTCYRNTYNVIHRDGKGQNLYTPKLPSDFVWGQA